jgi:hypothetical protein
LRLACGWCNRHKSSLTILFDARANPAVFAHPRLGNLLVPVPYWVVRVLGTQRKCQFPQCGKDSSTSPLVIAPCSSAGAMVPGNLGVYCDTHDPIREYRLVPRRLFK